MHQDGLVEIGEEVAKTFGVLRTVLIHANLSRGGVREYDITQQSLFEVHRTWEELAIGADARFETDHVEIEALCVHHADENVGKSALHASSQENGQRVLSGGSDADQLYDPLIPVAFPSALLFG